MEAAWVGDVEKIKSLSLQAWGPERDQPPLKITVSDGMGNTPFSIAFLRGHQEVARAILEIVKAQWSPVEKEKVRFKMETHDDDEEYSDEGSDASDDSEPRIVSEKVTQKFTIDDIGHVSMQVTSHVKPITVICEKVPILEMKGDKVESHGRNASLFGHALSTNNATQLKTLLDMAQHYSGQKLEGDDNDESGSWSFPQDDFMDAISSGRTQLLGLIIKRTGAGIPLDHLVKKSGVELKQRSRTYQGLTVYGKKRFVLYFGLRDV